MPPEEGQKVSKPLNEKVKQALAPAQQRTTDAKQRGMGSTIVFGGQVERLVEQPITDREAFINLLKCAFGTGCLAMPRAFCNAGWLFGFVNTLLIGFIVVYAMHVLINDINALCKRFNISTLSYSEAMELAVLCGPYWIQPLHRLLSYAVDLFLTLYHFGIICVYVIFIAKNVKHLCDIYLMPLDARIYMALIAFPLLLTFLVRELKYLVPFALLSNILFMLSTVFILVYVVNDLPDLDERDAAKDLSSYPLFFGTVLFSLESVGVILALEQNMLEPHHYLGKFGILNRAMVIVVGFYAIFGLLGYWQFGDDTGSSILYNLPIDEIMPQFIIGMYALAIFFSYSLQGYISVDIIWRHYLEPRMEYSGRSAVHYLLRMAIAIASVLCAIGYPDFGLFLSFVGSFCLTQLGIIYPGIINLCINYEEGYGKLDFLFWRSIGFIIMGVAGGIAGTISSMSAAVDQIESQKRK